MDAAQGTLEGHVVCSGCLRLVDARTGQVVPGWERVKFISAETDHLCGSCKEPLIENLSKAVPCS